MPIVIGNRNSRCYKASLRDVPRTSDYKRVSEDLYCAGALWATCDVVTNTGSSKR